MDRWLCPLSIGCRRCRYPCDLRKMLIFFLTVLTLSRNSLPCQIPSVFSIEVALPRLIRCELSRLRCHSHSLLLPSYLCRIKRKENSLCSACGHLLQDLITSSLTVPHPSLSGAPSSALLPFLTSDPDLGAWPDCWVSVEFLHTPIPRKGLGSTTITTRISVVRIFLGLLCVGLK